MNSPSLQTRRTFAKRVGLAIACAPSILRAADSTSLTAAVIGHTGRGDYGHGLESIFQNRPGVKLVALADPDEAGRVRIAAKIQAPRQYADYRAMLEKEKPNLVSVAMRQSDQHYAIVLAALKSGAHVYCEKPFTTTPAESDELIAVARQRGLKIAVAHTMRMAPATVVFKTALREGLIGELVEMRAYGKQDARAGGEDMMVLGSHLFDLMRLLAGDPQSCTARVLWKGREIVATERRLVKDNVGPVAGDEVFAQFSFGNGVNATFTSAATLRETVGHWGIELLGSKGAARINCDINPNVFIRHSTPWQASGKTDSWKPLDAGPVKPPPEHNRGPVGDWLDAIAKDREPECSGHNGAWAVEMVMGVYHAALSQSRVAFPLKSRSHPLEAGQTKL
ncbi:MAG TPA: Gfo/Idh/MocA family oxidoreductase [Methylomirabilota bacterium]|nr:Gfo/Idh/MocA family oxidoreductase [Methylomirabilota bacterium]